MLSYPRLATLVLFFTGACALAHPNHNATQRTDVTPVLSTETPPEASQVSITISGDQRIITANGLPDHKIGRFPNEDNPNGIRAQHYRFTVPAHPVVAKAITPLTRQPFGIAVNGVPFDPGTAEAWHNDPDTGLHYEAKGDAFSLGLDTNNGHVQPNGAYHYHGIPNDLLKRLSDGKAQMTLVGWAADGFPIYALWDHQPPDTTLTSEVAKIKTSYRLKSGKRPTGPGLPGGTYDGVFVEDFEYVAGSGDLDECSGRIGPTPEFPAGIYHYVLTEDFPFIPRAFRGTPDPSFKIRSGPPPGPGGPRRGPPDGRP